MKDLAPRLEMRPWSSGVHKPRLAVFRDMPDRSPATEQLTVLTQLIARPGHEAAIGDVLLRSVASARAEAGNISYGVHQLKNNPAAFYVLQDWTDQAALDGYTGSPRAPAVLTERGPSDLVAPPMRSRARMLSRPDVRPGRPRPAARRSAQVTLVPFFTIMKGEIDKVRNAHLSMVEPTRAEPGCIDYDLYQSLDDPSVMFFYENWTDAEALSRHMNTPNFYRFVRGDIDGRLVVPWTALIMTMLSDAGSGRGA
jgi:quinol monooxygenase YgiN